MTQPTLGVTLRRLLAGVVGSVVLGLPSVALAIPTYRDYLPTAEVGCLTCHTLPTGGARPECEEQQCDGVLMMEPCSCLNVFGRAAFSSLLTEGDMWTSALASEDHDGDGYSSGVELGDPDGDRDVDFPLLNPRSPGIASGVHGEDIDECAVAIDDCSDVATCVNEEAIPARRPSFECVCPANQLGDGHGADGCRPGWIPGDTVETATRAVDGVWYDYSTTFAFARIRSVSCGTYTRSVYFEPLEDCVPDSEWRVEVEGTPALILVGHGEGRFESLDACSSEASLDGLSASFSTGGPWVQIATDGPGNGRVRISCTPGPPPPADSWYQPIYDAHPWSYPTCRYGYPATDGLTPFVGLNLTADPGPACLPPRWGDLYLAYDASCSGTVRLGYTLPASFPDRGFRAPELRLAAFTAADCASHEQPLGCVVAPGAVCGDSPCWRTYGFPDAHLDIPARAGERLYFTAGGMGFPEGNLSIECDPTDNTDWCSAICDPGAVCELGAGTASCTCRERFVAGLCRKSGCECPVGGEVARECDEFGPGCDCRVPAQGDGVRPERGGTGCSWEHVCELYGMDCDSHGRCEPFETGPRCDCDPGYEDIGLTCRAADDCASNPCGTRPADHTLCSELPDGYACGCEPGFSADRSTTTFRCELRCGDGLKGPGEICDDGNDVDGDGCSTRCEVEPLFRCRERNLFETSYCLETCGDGLIDAEAGETCDDGNRLPGDGCSSTCQRVFITCQAQPGRSRGWPEAAWIMGLFALWTLGRRSRALRP